MLNFFRTTQNCRRAIHAFVLLASLFHHADHVEGSEQPFELVINHINHRRHVSRAN